MTPRKKPPPTIWELHARKIVLAGAALAAMAAGWTLSAPIRESGPLPVPSRVEVTTLRTESEQHFDAVSESLKQTLETAREALASASAARQQNNENRMRRLLDQQKEFQMRLDSAPGDRLFQDLLDTNKREIQKMLDESKLAK